MLQSRVVQATYKSMHYIEVQELQNNFTSTSDSRVLDTIIRDWKNHLLNDTIHQPPKAEEVLPKFPYDEIINEKRTILEVADPYSQEGAMCILAIYTQEPKFITSSIEKMDIRIKSSKQATGRLGYLDFPVENNNPTPESTSV